MPQSGDRERQMELVRAGALFHPFFLGTLAHDLLREHHRQGLLRGTGRQEGARAVTPGEADRELGHHQPAHGGYQPPGSQERFRLRDFRLAGEER